MKKVGDFNKKGIYKPWFDWAEDSERLLISEGGKICHISASIGISVAPESGRDFETLYKNADIALYRTKERGKNGFTIY